MSQHNKFIIDFIQRLLSAITNLQLYGIEHPQVVRLTSQAYETALKALEGYAEFSIAIIENELVIDGKPQEHGLFLDRFIHTMTNHGVGHIKVLMGITQLEIRDFILSIARSGEKTASVRSSEHFEVGRLDLSINSIHINEESANPAGMSGSRESAVTLESDPQTPRQAALIHEMPAKELAKFIEIYETIKHRRQLKLGGIINIVSDFVALFKNEGQALLVMATLRESDEYTFTHSTNVCLLNLAQAMALGIEGQMLNDIGVAGMLHDVGKLFVPEEVLNKKGALSDDEFRLIQEHPMKGARFLLETPNVPRLAIANAFGHHIKYNLSGYPKVPPTWKPNLCCHMTAISDIFDAMRTVRPYQPALPTSKIFSTMRQVMGTELHPGLTLNFLKIMSRVTNDPSILSPSAAT